MQVCGERSREGGDNMQPDIVVFIRGRLSTVAELRREHERAQAEEQWRRLALATQPQNPYRVVIVTR